MKNKNKVRQNVPAFRQHVQQILFDKIQIKSLTGAGFHLVFNGWDKFANFVSSTRAHLADTDFAIIMFNNL
jgi:hypothetical protein